MVQLSAAWVNCCSPMSQGASSDLQAGHCWLFLSPGSRLKTNRFLQSRPLSSETPRPEDLRLAESVTSFLSLLKTSFFKKSLQQISSVFSLLFRVLFHFISNAWSYLPQPWNVLILVQPCKALPLFWKVLYKSSLLSFTNLQSMDKTEKLV